MTRAQSEAMRRAMKATPMFSALDNKSLDRFIKRSMSHCFPAGEVIVEPGERADRFFVVLSGSVKVYKISPRGDEQVLHVFGAGNTFGEAAMWMGGKFPAFAEAVEESLLLTVPQTVLRQAVADDPDLALGIMAGLSSKLREFVRLIEDLSLKEVPARLAGVLLQEAESAGAKKFRMRQTKRQLAARIGTIAETLSRALKKLKAAGLIDVQGAEFTIRDAAALKKLSES
ncbi:MAG: Crp/Fnr family transcriptional regulator [Elusimicrobiota bacterium]